MRRRNSSYPMFRRFGAGELPLPNNAGQQTDVPSARTNPLIRRVPPYDPHIQADEVQLFREREMLKRGPSRELPIKPVPIVDIAPIPVTMIDWSGSVAKATSPFLAIPSNMRRMRFVIINPDTAAETLYLMFKNSPHSMLPIVVGGFYEEKGPTVSTDEIYIQCQTPGHLFGAYEGIRAEIIPRTR